MPNYVNFKGQKISYVLEQLSFTPKYFGENAKIYFFEVNNGV